MSSTTNTPETSIHPAALPLNDLVAQCSIQFMRRSGPGGQHRNKVSTAVLVRHRATGTHAEANERRSQAENRAVALFRLRVNLALEVRSLRKTGNVPSDLWRSRSSHGRIEINPRHDDFPSLLAEALDVMTACDDEPRLAGETLGCSATQLVRLLKKEPRALAQVNQRRLRRGLHGLR